MNTHMASDESLIKIFNAVSGSALSAAGDGRTAVLATGNVDAIDGFYNMMAKKGNHAERDERTVHRLVDGELGPDFEHLQRDAGTLVRHSPE